MEFAVDGRRANGVAMILEVGPTFSLTVRHMECSDKLSFLIGETVDPSGSLFRCGWESLRYPPQFWGGGRAEVAALPRMVTRLAVNEIHSVRFPRSLWRCRRNRHHHGAPGFCAPVVERSFLQHCAVSSSTPFLTRFHDLHDSGLRHFPGQVQHFFKAAELAQEAKGVISLRPRELLKSRHPGKVGVEQLRGKVVLLDHSAVSLRGSSCALCMLSSSRGHEYPSIFLIGAA